MLNDPLPTEADIRKLAVKQAKFSNCFAVSHLSRFAAATEQDDAKVSVEFEFGLDEQRRYQLLGKVSCSTLVICQRCLETMPLVLECNVNIVVVYDDIQAKQLPKAIEPLVVADGEVIDLNETSQAEAEFELEQNLANGLDGKLFSQALNHGRQGKPLLAIEIYQ